MLWFLELDFMKHPEMENLMVHQMESIEDVTENGNLDGLFDIISLGQKYETVLGSSVEASVGSSKGYRYGNLDGIVDGEVNMSMIQFPYLDPLKYLNMVSLSVYFKLGIFNWLL